MLADWVWTAFPWVLLTVGTAAAVGSYLTGRFAQAVGILFVLASISRVTVPVAGSNLRLEQVAVILIAGLILVRERAALYGLIRRAWLPFAFAVIYLVAHVAASATMAPQPLESLKIAAWLAISMGAGVIAAVVAFRARTLTALSGWILGAAALQVGVAAAAVTSQVLLDTEWGVQANDVLIGKAVGLSREANLFGILVAAALPFALLDPPDSWRFWTGRQLALVVWLAIGLGLAYSRGSQIAFAATAVAMVLVLVWTDARRPRWRLRATSLRVVMQASLVLVVAVGVIQVQDTFARLGARDLENVVVVGDVPAPSPTPRPTTSPGATPKPSAGPSSPPEYIGTGDTVDLRVRNLRQALQEFPESPIIGLGTDSYGQRHTEPSCRCPAHISNLTVATLYEAGLLGFFGLAGLLVVTGIAVIRLRAWSFGAAIVALLIGFQFTDAFRFAGNWILLGTVLGAAAASLATRRVAS
jgi:hypothetical protein